MDCISPTITSYGKHTSAANGSLALAICARNDLTTRPRFLCWLSSSGDGVSGTVIWEGRSGSLRQLGVLLQGAVKHLTKCALYTMIQARYSLPGHLRRIGQMDSTSCSGGTTPTMSCHPGPVSPLLQEAYTPGTSS